MDFGKIIWTKPTKPSKFQKILIFFRVYHTKPLTHPPEFSPRNTPPTSTSWWLNQLIWKIWVKIGSSSPIFGVNIKKYLSCHHQHPSLCHCFVPPKIPCKFASSKVNSWPVGESQPGRMKRLWWFHMTSHKELCCVDFNVGWSNPDLSGILFL